MSIDYQNFIYDKEKKVVFAYVPKVACSNWKSIMRHLAGYDNYLDTKFAHDRLKSGLLYLDQQDNAEVILNDPDIKVVACVREPYSRVLSAYLNKVEQRLEHLGKTEAIDHFDVVVNNIEEFRVKSLDVNKYPKITFNVFLKWLKESNVHYINDEHWLQQSMLLKINVVQFDFLGRFERLAIDAAEILTLINSPLSFPSQKDIKFKPTGAINKLEKYYDDECYALVNYIYTDDFVNFGYPMKNEKTSINPYVNLPSKAFWKPAVAEKSMFDVSELWEPKFNIQPTEKVAIFGSCFAQHIGNALKKQGFNWHISETPPKGFSDAIAKKYNYNIFTARTGNIYTTSLLKQWTAWALDQNKVPCEVWEKDGRYYDPFRPRIEPNGFETVNEMRLSRSKTIDSFKKSIEQSSYFVFTLGLTESWFNKKDGYEYPMCPGTVAGKFEESKHQFINQDFGRIRSDLSDAMGLMKKLNPKLRFILTVSPVPLTATMSGKHVALATMASKSVLRAVTDQLAMNRGDVDYFPSYEIINSPVFKGAFFEPNQRSVNPYGVKFVMDNFFKCLSGKFGQNIVQAKS
jgi:hypothetical protein